MKQFIQTENKTYSFSSCETCPAKCCNGKEGTTFSQIILEDFNMIHKKFPILFIFGELGYIKPVVLLTNGKEHCKYLKDFRCSVYEQRPSVCRVYPLSANIDNNIYIDELCPAVNDKDNKSKTIIKENFISSSFDYNILHDYQDKYIDTHYELEQFNKKENFSLAITINGMSFFKCDINFENQYMQMHQKSLIHLQDEYFIS